MQGPFEKALYSAVFVLGMAIAHGAYSPRLWVDAWHYSENGLQGVLSYSYNPRKRLMSFFFVTVITLFVMWQT